MIYHRSSNSDSYDLHGLESDVKKSVARLKSRKGAFDSIVVTGMSGVILGVPVAMKLRKPLVILRKEHDDTHQHRSSPGGYKWINHEELGVHALFLDDFVSNGDTARRVKDAVAALGSTVVAEYMYREHEYKSLTAKAPK